MCLLWSEGVICYSRVGETELSQRGNDNILTVPGSGSSAEPGATTAKHWGAATHRKHPSSRSLRRGNNYVSYVLLITIRWKMEEVSDDCGYVCLKTLSSVLGHRPPSKKKYPSAGRYTGSNGKPIWITHTVWLLFFKRTSRMAKQCRQCCELRKDPYTSDLRLDNF